ncbi:MAG TPA: pyridoxal-5-phosphate-dependent protein subunit beta [Chloroflexi bacterium]|nr:pyridoxal-5-phosphate-dependent protein subunit beta [Chloroflexota bacterium]
MIDLTVYPERLERAVQRARERNIIIPTFKQMKSPERIPARIKEQLAQVGLWDLNSLNLFRITWKNQPVSFGGGFNGVNYVEFPKELTGVDARIIALVGKWFPTGAHKVGAAFSCLVPRLVTGQFDPTTQKAVWPSTGNYCRGGAYDSALLGCESVAILPEGMSRERFEWLSTVAGEVIATPGTESNVKEIFDKCWELRRSGEDLMIFNQFEEFGNHLWHYDVTGHAMQEVLEQELGPGEAFRGSVFTTGSAGTIAAGDYLKERFPTSKLAASEALQCPTLLLNGFGAHRIEGIGDKHVPWIHNVRNTDLVVAVDDEAPVSLIRLFNEPEGQQYLARKGIPLSLIKRLPWLGISGVANLLAAIKMVKWYEWGEGDVVMTVLTDSMEMYGSRLHELTVERGELSAEDAAGAYHRYLLGQSPDFMEELTYPARKRVHNLKYYTWVEQQGKTYEEIQAQWYQKNYWSNIHSQVDEIDALIEAFNARAGLL